jgi:hypothetical protein
VDAAIYLERAAFVGHMGSQDLANRQVIASRVFSSPFEVAFGLPFFS